MDEANGYVWVRAATIAAQASALIERRRRRLEQNYEEVLQRVMDEGVLSFSLRRLRFETRKLSREEAQLAVASRRWPSLELALLQSRGGADAKLLDELLRAAQHSETTNMLLSTYAVALL